MCDYFNCFVFSLPSPSLLSTFGSTHIAILRFILCYSNIKLQDYCDRLFILTSIVCVCVCVCMRACVCVRACVRACVQDIKWLHHSIALHDWAWKYGWDKSCGGFWWSNCEESKFKDSIIIVQMLHLSSKLAYLLPNETRFLHKAIRTWDWFFHIDNGQGMMSDQFLVSTGVVPERCCNATSDEYTRCQNSKQSGTSYNQGLLMSAAAYLYLSTGNETFLKTGVRAAEAILANYTTAEGILVDEPRGYQSFMSSCYSGSDPGGDWYSFNGIFMLHLGYFTELLVKNGTMPEDLLGRIKTLVQDTSDAAWMRSAVFPPFKGIDNVCKPGSSSAQHKPQYPKFHWWWGHNVKQQKIPPDPRYYFHALELSCKGNNTQLWSGSTGSELKCTQRCNKHSNCSKYSYTEYQEGDTDCWLWSYNRSDHMCDTVDYSSNVGIKRPIGNATCAGRCGSGDSQGLSNGTVCYCDASCVKHLDCCLDYADHCTSKTPISCKGQCSDSVHSKPQVISGGGYCWCSESCHGWYTDNNSDGSCCPDYPEQCEQISIPACLDGRTQGSALNLFLGHFAVSKSNWN